MSPESKIPHDLMSRFSDFIAAVLGLHFPRRRWHDLERGVRSALHDLAQPDIRTCIEWLMSRTPTKSDIELLASHLTVGETYFFRDEKSFDALEMTILPELIRRRRGGEKRLRLWSAGCCTGEEPYSLAILLRRMIPDWDNWAITLLATDINPHFLRKAEKGLYSPWSFRATPSWVKERYFEEAAAGQFQINTQARRQVTYSYLNLAEDVYPSLLTNTNAMDVIFCRNVLMYFSAERALRAVDHLYDCLVRGGWLIVSPSEASQTLFHRFTTVMLPGAILYQKPIAGDHAVAPGRVADWPAFIAPPPAIMPPVVVNTVPPVTVAAPAHSVDDTRPTATLDARAQALMWRDASDDPETVDALFALVAREPDRAAAMVRLARMLANGGRLSEARAWAEKAIAKDKLMPAAHYLLGIILQEQGIPADAVASLKRALYLDPNFALAHFLLATLMRHQGNECDAQRHFRNALASLARYGRDEYPPESEGTTAGRLLDVIAATAVKGEAA
ncbi:MAG: CheR family methyltransferase [Acidiferrobacter sp.]